VVTDVAADGTTVTLDTSITTVAATGHFISIANPNSPRLATRR
jgi:hypothetical protein